MMREMEVTEMKMIELTEMAIIQMQMIDMTEMEMTETAKIGEGDPSTDGDAGACEILHMLEY